MYAITTVCIYIYIYFSLRFLLKSTCLTKKKFSKMRKSTEELINFKFSIFVTRTTLDVIHIKIRKIQLSGHVELM